MRRCPLTAVVLSVSALFSGAAPALAAGAAPTLLRQAITLEEATEQWRDQKRVVLPLSFGVESQDVDVNSTIRVRVDTDQLQLALAGLAGADLSPHVGILVRASEKLRLGAEFLEASLADAKGLAELALAGERESAEFRQLVQKDQSRLNAVFNGILLPYYAELAASPEPRYRERAAASRARVSALLIRPSARLPLAAALLEEVQWLLGELERAGVEEQQSPRAAALLLAAYQIRNGQEVELPLPNYNRLPVGPAVPFDKLNLVPSPEQAQELAALQKEATAWSQILNQLRSGGAEVEQLARRLLAARGIDVAPLESATRAVRGQIGQLQAADWTQVGEQLQERLDQELQGQLSAAERQALEALRPRLTALRDDARAVRGGVAGLAGQLEVLGPRLQEGAALSGNPLAALQTLLSVAATVADAVSGVEGVLANLQGAVAATVRDAEKLRGDLAPLKTGIAALPQQLRDRFQAILTATAESRLAGLVTALQELQRQGGDLLAKLRDLVPGERTVLALTAAADLPPPASSLRVPVGEAQNTWIDLQTVHPRSENDGVVLRAWLYPLDDFDDGTGTVRLAEGQPLDQVAQSFRLLRCGWFGSYGAGVTYLQAASRLAGQDEKTSGFTPQVSWLLRHRPWRTGTLAAGEPARIRSRRSDWVAFGFHTVAVDLDNDNQQELGLGVTVSFFKDFLQLGAGVDLSLDRERYYFIGIKLLEMARNVGIQQKPAGGNSSPGG